MGRPRRRQSSRTLADPQALAAQLPDELSSFHPVPGSHHFHDHARRVAEWLNTQHPGLGYLTPAVMAAAGLTASDWFRQSLAVIPAVTEFAEDGAQRRVMTVETEDEDVPSMFVYDPDLSSVPPREPRGTRAAVDCGGRGRRGRHRSRLGVDRPRQVDQLGDLYGDVLHRVLFGA